MSKYQLSGLLLAAIASTSIAALPPKYLAVKDFKQCLAVQESGTYHAWCLPPAKPQNCPTASWDELKALTGNDRVPDCPAATNQRPEPAQQPSGK